MLTGVSKVYGRASRPLVVILEQILHKVQGPFSVDLHTSYDFVPELQHLPCRLHRKVAVAACAQATLALRACASDFRSGLYVNSGCVSQSARAGGDQSHARRRSRQIPATNHSLHTCNTFGCRT